MSLQNEYNKYWKVTDIFPVNSVGIVTARDNLTIKWSYEEIWNTVSNFSNMNPELARQFYKLGKDARDWKVELAQKDLKESGLDRHKIISILYRPFDIRYTYYTGKSRGFLCMPRPEVMQHMIYNNLGLITVRQVAEGKFNHAFITDKIVESRITLSNKGIAYLFPLYLYDKIEKDVERKVNLNPEFIRIVSERCGTDVSYEMVLFYIYAILYSNKYRTIYAEFLKNDFPRIPLPTNYSIFEKLSNFGKEIVDLHLMKNRQTSNVRFNLQGSNIVESVHYENNKVYINKEQYFDGVPVETWNYQIGGYKVLDKWLKSRKTMELKSQEIEHFIQVIEIVKHTIELTKRIDEVKFIQ